MINTLPDRHSKILSSAIAQGDFDTLKHTIEQNKIDINSYLLPFYSPIIMAVLTSFGIKDETQKMDMLRYCLEKGADPNLNSKGGYNSLHVAVQQQALAKALNLFLEFGGDVNLTDKNGNTVAYWAIQGFPWRTEGEERKLHLTVLEKILMLGADLDHKNKFGITPRKWLEHSAEDVRQLVSECEKRNPVYQPSNTTQPKFPTNYKFPELVEQIRSLIPVKGRPENQAAEMLSALDMLKDEAHRNGNVNYYSQHKKLAELILTGLTSSTFFDRKEKDKMIKATKKLMNAKKPYLEDDVYDYLTDQICIYYRNDLAGNENKKWWKFWE